MKTIFLSILVSLSCLTGCTQQNSSEMKKGAKSIEEASKNTPKATLQSELDAKKAAFESRASKEKLKLYGDGIEAVVESGITKSAKQVGDTAPNFSLKNATGETVQLADYLKKGPVVLTWYRGNWCPYCNMT
ncbi:MAG: redoxin domain-containing protein, partial [Saprospiraceae bacterium]